MQILVVEDHGHLADLTRRNLVEDGYVVDVAYSGQEAIDKFDINSYNLVVLDIMLPEVDGFGVCAHIRKSDINIPIIMLTARDDIDDRVKGLDSGADDYLVKPFSFSELSARVRALLRRGSKAAPTTIQVGQLRLDPAAKQIYYDEKALPLTAKEYVLLQYFMHHPNEVISKTELLEHVWDMNYQGLSNVVETYVRYLRSKLRNAGGNPELIQTVRNLGYKLSDA